MNNTLRKSLQNEPRSVFDKTQVIGLHRAGKSARQVSLIMAIGLRTVQRAMAQWKIDAEVQSSIGNSGRTKILNTRDRRLEKANQRKSVQHGPKKMSARIMHAPRTAGNGFTELRLHQEATEQ